MVIGIVWVCKRYFGLFREIEKDALPILSKNRGDFDFCNDYLFPDNRCDEVSASASFSDSQR